MAERKNHLHAARTGVRIAVVGADSLLGRELRDQLNNWSPTPALELISATVDDAAVLDIQVSEEEPLALVPLNAQSLEGARVAILAGTPASSRRALKSNPASGPVLIDLTGALEDHPQARLRAPLVQGQPVHAPGIQVVANAASSALAALYITLAEHTIIRRSLAHIFEPASERGKQGLNELQQQTVAVLAFKKLKKRGVRRPACLQRVGARGRRSAGIDR